MSENATFIREQFPDKRMWFLKPRELDIAILMVEEGVDPDLAGHLRIVYQKEAVLGILNKELGWPINRIMNYLMVSAYWTCKTKRAPIILDKGQVEALMSGGGYGGPDSNIGH